MSYVQFLCGRRVIWMLDIVFMERTFVFIDCVLRWCFSKSNHLKSLLPFCNNTATVSLLHIRIRNQNILIIELILIHMPVNQFLIFHKVKHCISGGQWTPSQTVSNKNVTLNVILFILNIEMPVAKATPPYCWCDTPLGIIY